MNASSTKRSLKSHYQSLAIGLSQCKNDSEMSEALKFSMMSAQGEGISPVRFFSRLINDSHWLDFFNRDDAARALNRLINQLENQLEDSSAAKDSNPIKARPHSLNRILPASINQALIKKNFEHFAQLMHIHHCDSIPKDPQWLTRSSAIENYIWANIKSKEDLVEIGKYARIELQPNRLNLCADFNRHYIQTSRLDRELPASNDPEQPFNSFMALMTILELAKKQDFKNAVYCASALFNNPCIMKSNLNAFHVLYIIEALQPALKIKRFKESIAQLTRDIDQCLSRLAIENEKVMMKITQFERNFKEDLLYRSGCPLLAQLVFKYSFQEARLEDYFLKANARYPGMTINDVMSVYTRTQEKHMRMHSLSCMSLMPYLTYAVHTCQRLYFSKHDQSTTPSIEISTLSHFYEWHKIFKENKHNQDKRRLMISMLSDMIISATRYIESSKNLFAGARDIKALVRLLPDYVDIKILNELPIYNRNKLCEDLSL